MESAGRSGLRLFLEVALLAFCCRCCLSGECPADGRVWETFGNSCYHFVHGKEDVAKTYTIEKAREMCHGYGLLCINSEEENKFIVKYSSRVWKDTEDIWLDMYFDPDNDTLVWQDQTPVVYTNWEDVDDLTPMDTCASADSSSGKWVRVSCEDSYKRVVCETKQVSENAAKRGNSQLLSVLVILSVVVILGFSTAVWFLSQKHSFAPTLFTSFEYHPPFRSPKSDETTLVEAEETEAVA
ncbi:CD302 antigen-like [Scleropages formosus]|uniref:CD302 antigen-like n=1 Tax=Scleropages formosus TaxID=113540 RepID=A0A0P7VI45_SCLFO|nr:CD302 antigen [Scleropages formosus]KPP75214.1 CD302 antigen-like [Scleropages formosus]